MKKLLSILLAAMMILSMTACSNKSIESAQDDITSDSSSQTPPTSESNTPDFITVTTLNGSKEEMELEVPYNPERIAVMDLGALDILDNLGLGDRIVGMSKGSSIDYLQSYVTNDDIMNLGTVKEADMEAVMECEPDVIFIGGRLSSIYDELSKIAPVVYLATDVEIGVIASTGRNAKTIASLFGLEDQIDALLDDYDARIAALQAIAEGKTAIVGMVTSGGFNVLGNDGRCSMIGKELGFENIGVDADIDTSTHGNDASFEFLIEINPDYIFIMDRDAAINAEGAQLAQEVMDNELVPMTAAYKNGNIVYLEHSNVWYTAEGGITALGIMLQDLENSLLGQ